MSLSPLEPSFKPSSGLTLCEDAAAFIQHLVVCSLYGMDPKHQVVVPKTISNTLLEDLYLAHRIFDKRPVRKMNLTRFNLDCTSWSLEEYREKGISVDDYDNDTDGGKYEHVTAVIPGRSKEILRDRPCNLRDKNGRIWCWFFPGLISKHRQAANHGDSAAE
ncbi:hypothetical protein FA13DRAFT_1720438 [Coprinellus micaceus]|uniref:Uncharacterized protein n=1 Tax=Coprinellus micaceus TaxID=71717 RepID=A0A4Y7S9D4_COPMI|nr:hypothetical protein FA13DRAFT_1720438 [Coprinellus micaceus]